MGLDIPGEAPVLPGDGVLLTPWETTDLPAIVQLADEVGRHWSRSLADVRTDDDAQRWLTERSGRGRIDWAVRDPQTRAVVGRTSLHRFDEAPPAAEIGYGVHPDHRRRGVAAAAVAAATGYGFDTLGLSRVELVHDTGNVASCAVASRSGFALEGLERQALGYPDGRVADLHRHARLVTDPPGPAEAPPASLEPVELALGGLLLRPWQPTDAEDVLLGLSDPLHARWNPRLPLRDLDQARGWLQGRAQGWRDGRAASWAVTEGGRVVGSVGLRDLNLVDRFATASYWTMPAERGRGMAPRALARVTSYAYEVLGMHRVKLLHAAANTGSCRVAEKAGFRMEATMRESNLLADGFTDEHLHARLVGDR